MIKVMIVDDQPVVINELTHLIEDSWTARVVDTAVDGKAAIPSALKKRPDLILLDVSLPDMNGIEIARELKSAWPEVKILAISAYPDSLYVDSMLDAGALGYLLKDNVQDEQVNAIQSISIGKQWLGKGLNRSSET